MATTGAPAQDLRLTPHNFARQGAAAAAASESSELCVFCHTPTVQSGGLVPLWQRSLESAFAFPTYDDIGNALLGRVGSHSLACLSCHDAAQARNAGSASVSSERDHPVGVPYRGVLDAAPGRADALDVAPGRGNYKPASSGLVDGKPAWWVSPRGPGGMRTRTDLPLFPGSPGGGAEPVPLIECGTCHDPHSAAPLFLRVAPRGSQLCLTCHDL